MSSSDLKQIPSTEDEQQQQQQRQRQVDRERLEAEKNDRLQVLEAVVVRRSQHQRKDRWVDEAASGESTGDDTLGDDTNDDDDDSDAPLSTSTRSDPRNKRRQHDNLSSGSGGGKGLSRRNLGASTEIRPGAYSKAPGQDMVRMDSVRNYDPRRSQQGGNRESDDQLKSSLRDERKRAARRPGPAVGAFPSSLAQLEPLEKERAMMGNSSSNNNSSAAAGTATPMMSTSERRKGGVRVAAGVSLPQLEPLGKVARASSEPTSSSSARAVASAPSTTTTASNQAGASGRLSPAALEMRKAALSMSLTSHTAATTTTTTTTACSVGGNRQAAVAASVTSMLDQEDNKSIDFDNKSIDNKSTDFLEKSAEFSITSPLPPMQQQLPDDEENALPVAAEVVKCPEAVEEEIRERLEKEYLNCSVAEAVPAAEDDEVKKQKCWMTAVVVAVVLVVVVIVGGIVAGVVLTGGDEDDEAERSIGHVDSSAAPPNVLADEGVNGTSLNWMNGTEFEEEDEGEGSDDFLAMFSENDTIARVLDTICYERAPMMGWSYVCPPQPNGSSVSNMIAASRLWSVPEANISILNAGEVKDDILEGNFTFGMAQTVLPYPNTLVTLGMEGYNVAIVLERGIQRLFDDLELMVTVNRSFSGGSYPYAAGVRFDVDMTQSFPRRLSNIQVYTGPSPPPEVVMDRASDEALWKPIQMQGVIYTIVTNSYIANGGDGYHEFNSEDSLASPQQDTGLSALEEFVTYCQTKKVLLRPPPGHMSTQSYIHDPNIKYCSCDDGVEEPYNASARL